ncbi:MBOAT family protein [Rhizobium ruizarguesonis]|jgi:alginate O-acetyltransferase complex protein AlgI|uniref:MBOAT family O-acyltransferase n=1 Tax=Rhizobium ruizarguesonis TaxID=2081791 RepID=UPI001030A92B|nr:MBOAT family protein [Rhizobium ruizarguesonis]MBY5886442.1 MBOAT family protein [Rhizobium leguminosarum]QSZ01772.1 MBOAT family protein [Rhizobium ruizarguesonis]TAZ82171.1 MBOAT family protein [Rhizobium ruizarguesonis]
MLFSSPVFVSFFLPLAIFSYFLLPFRSVTLLILSLAFYAWGDPVMVWLLIFVIVFNYVFGLSIHQSGRYKRLLLGIGVAVNLLVLIIFKYAAFIVDNLDILLRQVSLPEVPVPHILLPLGVSFFTFQAISYLVDIYRRDVQPERNLIRMGVFKAFFPQLIAGPIVRYKEIAGDLRDRTVRLESFSAGAERFVIGLAKKLLIADPLSIPVDVIFRTDAGDLSSPLAWMGIASFGLQIYFDFSAYSDMAIGLAKMFGFHFPENFDMPYTASSVQDFWRRWHMTLSRWFRDYLYIPLGGNRYGQVRTTINLWIVFATTGIWHGANWTFLIWGLWHGALLTLERTKVGRSIERWPLVVRRSYTIVAVLIGWVWFRSQNVDHATGYLYALFFGGFDGAPADILRLYNPFLLSAFCIGAALAIGAYPKVTGIFGCRVASGEASDVLVASSLQEATRNLALVVVGAIALSAAAASTLQAFLYFRF